MLVVERRFVGKMSLAEAFAAVIASVLQRKNEDVRTGDTPDDTV